VKCDTCRKAIASGTEFRRRAEYHRHPDGTVRVFGHGMPDGELADAVGQLVAVKHSGCYWSARKHEQRAQG
jgi:hypothetical protein